MSTSFTFRRTVAGAITITATFFAATACGSATDVSQSITRTSKETPTNKAYPADGRENRNSARNASTHRQYPADGRENRNAVNGSTGRQYPADGRENRNAVNGSTGRQYPADGRENRNSGAPLPLPRGRDTCC